MAYVHSKMTKTYTKLKWKPTEITNTKNGRKKYYKWTKQIKTQKHIKLNCKKQTKMNLKTWKMLTW